MDLAEPVRRTLDIEDKTNLFLVHPLSNRLVPILAGLHVSPNAVSICGMVCGILAGVAYHNYAMRIWVVLGFALMIAWHVMDGADGQLARLTNTQSSTGKVLDGICDYVTFTSVYVGLALQLSRHYGAWVWAMVAAAGLCHAVQSASYELQRQDYDHWGCGRKSAVPTTTYDVSPNRSSPAGQAAQSLDRIYGRLQLLATGVDRTRRLEMAGMFAHASERADVRMLYRDVFAPRVRQWSVMSANYHTLAIFVFALSGYPILYFFWEIAALSLLTVLLLSGQRRLYAIFFMRACALGLAET